MPGPPTSEYAFDTAHDRYPVAAHVFLLRDDDQVLLMRRAGSGYADGRLGLPAGHVDLGETPSGCLAREAHEELGIRIDPGHLRPTNTMFRLSQEPRVDLFFTTRYWEGRPRIREPHKCLELVWADPTALPEEALEFLAQAFSDSQGGVALREYGFEAADVS